jgi:uncharacterized Zn-binding protein involved in type VI secretion
MPPAARMTDNHTCPLFDGPKPHVGGPILPPCAVNVQTNSLGQARATDRATCASAPDAILMGSMSVRVNSLMAARQTDQTVHGGVVVMGSPNVEIGGAPGSTVGFPLQWAHQCAAAAQGRTSGSTQQSYSNCGVESARQIIGAAGGSVNEDTLLNEAIANNDAENATDPADRGGTSPQTRTDILSRRGVASHREAQTMANIQSAVVAGHGVITSHDAGVLWNDPAYNGGGHAIVVTGMEYDANGNLVNVLVNDTGTGRCLNSVPASQFQNSLNPSRQVNVTDNPVIR